MPELGAGSVPARDIVCVRACVLFWCGGVGAQAAAECGKHSKLMSAHTSLDKHSP